MKNTEKYLAVIIILPALILTAILWPEPTVFCFEDYVAKMSRCVPVDHSLLR